MAVSKGRVIKYLYSINMLLIAALLTFVIPQTGQAEEMIYGRELMTQQELRIHQQKMRSLQGEEREQYRIRHHERMQERAKERGVTLPEEPLDQGRGKTTRDRDRDAQEAESGPQGKSQRRIGGAGSGR